MEWARVVASGDTYDISFRIRRFDGVYRWFKTRAVPLRDPAGRILKWFGSNTDIEDFVVAERKLKVQLERMQLLDRTTHAIGAHHELRKVFEVVLRSLEDNLDIDFACLCVYQAEPELLTRQLRGRTRRGARPDDRPRRAGAHRGRRERPAVAACTAKWCTSPISQKSRLPFTTRLAERRACARWWPRRS